jgi:predicted deacylase
MLPKTKRKSPLEPVIARSSKWVRATSSGLLKTVKPLGARVKRYDLLALVDDPLGDNQTEIKAPFSGIIIGRTEIPLVHEGEAVFHIARFEDLGEAEERVDEFHDVENEKSIPGLEQEPPVI